MSSIKTLLKPIEPVQESDHLQLTSATRKQLHSLVSQFHAGQGNLALFTGGSGTGKAMAAELLTSEYGMQLFKVDLGAVMSKYIGETEKNLSNLFETAQEMDVVLLFDEADSLFGKRTEVGSANDRYANLETNYLLQRIETHSGLVILTSNLRKQLDDTLLRRASWVIEIDSPEKKRRLRLWQLVPSWLRNKV